MSDSITYLDNNATTKVDPRVADEMVPLLTERYGNPSSVHHFGAQVGAAVEEARSRVAALIGARESEIVFTSGGTEADNAALRGVLAARPSKRHLVISAVEHHAIFEPCELFEREGVEVTRVGVDEQGRLNLDALRNAVRDDTALVSLMLANNETGVTFPLKQAVEIAKERGALVHTDAVNAIGKMHVNVDELGVNLLSLSAHKFHGPKGCGALYLRRGTPFRAMQVGGGQERGRRGGTLNAPGIIGLGRACALVSENGDDAFRRLRGLRDRLEARIIDHFPDAHICGREAERLPNTACVCFPQRSSEALLLLLSEAGICVSSGSACSSGSLEPSHVLEAMGIDPRVSQGQIRFSFGRFNGEEDIDRVLEVLPRALEKVGAANV